MKKFVVWLFTLIAGCTVAASIWLSIPLKSGPHNPDAAVIFANKTYPGTDEYSEDYFEHEGITLHYIESGTTNSETIVFIHGFPSNWFSFIRQLEYFRSDYHVVAIDGLGAGLSDAPSDITHYTLDSMSQHVVALLQHLGISQAHFVGHDWGSALAFGMAQKYPELTTTVTGISAPPQNVMLNLMLNNEKQQATSRYVERLKSANPIILKAFRAPQKIWAGRYQLLVEKEKLNNKEAHQFRLATKDVKRINAHINWYRANLPKLSDVTDTSYWPGKNTRVTVPALVVWGNDDDVFVPEFISVLQRLSSDLTVLKLDNTGHWPHVEESNAVSDAIDKLLDRKKVTCLGIFGPFDN